MNMDKPAEKISFDDPRVQRRTATINGKTYGIVVLLYDLEASWHVAQATFMPSQYISILERSSWYTLRNATSLEATVNGLRQIHGFPDLSMGWRY